VAFWFYHDVIAADTYYNYVGCMAGAGSAATDQWFVQRHAFTGDEGVNFGYSDGIDYRVLVNEAPIVAGRWYMFAGSIDNDVTPVLGSEIWDTSGIIGTATAGGTGFINTLGNQPLALGKWAAGTPTPLIGRLDKVGIWNREFTGGETAILHNGGTGLRGSALPTALQSGLQEYYDLDERSGASVWRALLSRNLTASGTVLSKPPAGRS
jgi:hypothetical protein